MPAAPKLAPQETPEERRARRTNLRARFEEWARGEGYDLKRAHDDSGGPYVENDTQFAWNGFKFGVDY